LTHSVETATHAAPERDPRHLEGLAFFKKGHEELVENLETVIAAGTTILLACISRAGGAELSEEERAQMHAQWDAAVNAAKTT